MKIVSVLGILLVIVSGFFLYVDERNRQSYELIRNYPDLIEDYKTVNGVYPENLETFVIQSNNSIVGFLPTNEIRYKILDDSFMVYFIEYPLGPSYVYSGKNKTWQYEEI